MFRYRKLTPHGPRDTRAEHRPFNGESLLVGAADAIAGGVQEVSADERTADLETLNGLLREKSLMKTDLVFSHGQWRTFAEAPEFSALCEGLVDTRALKATLRAAAVFVLFLAAYVLWNWWAIANG